MTSDTALHNGRDPNGPLCPLSRGGLASVPANCPRTAFDPVIIDGSKLLAPLPVHSRRGGSEDCTPEAPIPTLGNPGELPEEGLGKVIRVKEVPPPPLCHVCRREQQT
jgi:hypothetical protein